MLLVVIIKRGLFFGGHVGGVQRMVLQSAQVQEMGDGGGVDAVVGNAS